ncbi:helix-turn-helix domain-containing protein [Paenibacillus sp. LHD-117]|uniref:TetR/AcrR family transcriptional regulator n=1 Tax=Paenibacillus sp. LHD-117 TaxID=3071412 RepID=UPI0027E06C6E|nr:helix-turn-helix domain-containing protein [Paenibacillus sp. LHD-117]MDQ6421796.1 helix-turn-helix domain-containing protein [Paenibacillus sp. LHD-117]
MKGQNEQWLNDLLRLADEDGSGKKTEKQARILEAAIEIFAEKGYAAASTSEIAQKAGVAEGTIFRHYKTKKDLLLSIAGPIAVKIAAPFLLRDFAKMLELPYERVDDFFRSVAKDRFQFARQHMKLIRIFVHEVPFQPELLQQVKELFENHVFRRMEKVIIHFQAQGQLIEAPPWRIMRSTVSLLIGMIVTHLLLMPDEHIDEDEEIERTIDILMHGLAAR